LPVIRRWTISTRAESNLINICLPRRPTSTIRVPRNFLEKIEVDVLGEIRGSFNSAARIFRPTIDRRKARTICSTSGSSGILECGDWPCTKVAMGRTRQRITEPGATATECYAQRKKLWSRFNWFAECGIRSLPLPVQYCWVAIVILITLAQGESTHSKIYLLANRAPASSSSFTLSRLVASA
jgi:hypothetical protein